MLPDFVRNNLRKQLNILELHIFQNYLLTELSDTSSNASDWMVTFPTGSGKTLAYLLPLIGKLTITEDRRPKCNTTLKIKRRSLRAMIVLPTRDLVEQVAHVVRQLLTGFEDRLRFAMCHGGQSFKEEQKLLVASQGNLSFLNDLLHEDLTNTGQSLCDYNYRLPSSSLIDLLITTPGRLLEHLAETESFLLDDLEVIVLDEVDRLLASDFGEWLSIIYRKSAQKGSSKLNCRKWLFSATSIHDPAKLETLGLSKDLKYLRVGDMKKMENSKNSSKKFKNAPENSTIDGSRIIEALDSPKGDTCIEPLENEVSHFSIFPSGLSHWFMVLAAEQKAASILYLVEKHQWRKVLVFTRSIHHTEILTNLLSKLSAILVSSRVTKISVNFKISALSSRTSTEKRRKVLKQSGEEGTLLKDVENSFDIIVATDTLARGLDLIDLSAVIHYDVPQNVTSYIHRSGRTARNNSTGISMALLSPQEAKHFKSFFKDDSEIYIGKEQESSNMKIHLKKYIVPRTDPKWNCLLRAYHGLVTKISPTT